MSDLPSMPEVEWALLKLLEHKRRVRTDHAYKLLAEKFHLSTVQRQQLVSERSPESAWEVLCRSARKQLVEGGYMNRAPHGEWSITDEGSRKAKAMTEEYGRYVPLTEEDGL